MLADEIGGYRTDLSSASKPQHTFFIGGAKFNFRERSLDGQSCKRGLVPTCLPMLDQQTVAKGEDCNARAKANEVVI